MNRRDFLAGIMVAAGLKAATFFPLKATPQIEEEARVPLMKIGGAYEVINVLIDGRKLDASEYRLESESGRVIPTRFLKKNQWVDVEFQIGDRIQILP